MLNRTQYVAKQKFRRRLVISLTNLCIFIVLLLGYILIMNIEKNTSQANVYFILALVLALESAVAIVLIPNDREGTFRTFKWGILGYALATILFEVIIFGATRGNDGGGDIMRALTQIRFYITLITPIGLIIWQGKRFMHLTGIGKSKRDTIEYLKKHGNDGMN